MDRTCGGGGRVRCEMSAMIARDDERGKAIDGRSNCGRVDDGSRVLRPQRRRRAGGVLSTLWGPAFAFLPPPAFSPPSGAANLLLPLLMLKPLNNACCGMALTANPTSLAFMGVICFHTFLVEVGGQ